MHSSAVLSLLAFVRDIAVGVGESDERERTDRQTDRYAISKIETPCYKLRITVKRASSSHRSAIGFSALVCFLNDYEASNDEYDIFGRL